ncbi:hypothetical protein HCN44_003200 [Aphidius gifuensis]|uniref:Ionotropic receptor n=1 Tax=Aphidius gifuensis TaxID=684658 RepID=A0A835CMU5_APHGI|nr:hypothetical protein HCN44_003200 [Aphidius gifuensis]
MMINIPKNETNFGHIIDCAAQLIDNILRNTDTVKIYANLTQESSTDNAILLVKKLFELSKPVVFITNDYHGNTLSIMGRKLYVAFVSEIMELEMILKFFYYEKNHKQFIICITYTNLNILDDIYNISSKIWIKGIPRNVIFVASKQKDNNNPFVIGVSSYSEGNCKNLSFTHIGQYSNGVLKNKTLSYYPPNDNLGGCELSIMIQPPFLPYIENINKSKPDGYIPELIDMLSESMNFTPKYETSWTLDRVIEHLNSSDLHIAFDMLPRSSLVGTNYKFSIGMTNKTWAVTKGGYTSIWTKLLTPFDKYIWLLIIIMITLLLIVSKISNDPDTLETMLKLFGSLLGVGVGNINNTKWLKLFFCFWLLPTYVLTQYYLGYLTNSFTILPQISEINTLKDLRDSGIKIICTNYGKNTTNKWLSQNEIELLEKCHVLSDDYYWNDFYQRFLKSGMLNNTAIVANLEYVDGNEAFLNLHTIQEGRTNVNQLVHAKPGSDWIFHMNKLYNRVYSTGLIEHWKNKYSTKKKRQETNVRDEYIHIDILKCAFILELIGLLISFIVFIGELIIHYNINDINEI